MFIIKSYLNSKFRWRVLGDIALLGIFALFLWSQGLDILLPLSAGVVVLAIIEILFFFRKHILPAVLSLVFVILASYFSYASYALLVSNNISDEETSYFVAGGVGLIAIVSMVITIIGSYLFGKGRVWITLLLGYLLFFVAFVLTGVIVPTLSPMAYSAIGAVIMIMIMILRCFFPRAKRIYFNWNLIPHTKQTTLIKKKLEQQLIGKEDNSNKTNIQLIPADNQRYFFLRTSYAFMAVLPIVPTQSLILEKNKMLLDGVDITGVLEAYMDELSLFSTQQKINLKYITPVIYVGEKSQIGTEIGKLDVARKTQPDRVLGSVFMVSPKGFVSLLNRMKTNGVKLPEEIIDLT